MTGSAPSGGAAKGVAGIGRSRLSPRAIGLIFAALSLLIDQGHKLWMLNVFHIELRQPFALTPFLDLVLAWNKGISYSLFTATSDGGRWILLAFTLVATLILAIWMWRTPLRVTGAGLGLIVGGALGNAYDRFAYGAVADFFHIHVGSFSWRWRGWRTAATSTVSSCRSRRRGTCCG